MKAERPDVVGLQVSRQIHGDTRQSLTAMLQVSRLGMPHTVKDEPCQLSHATGCKKNGPLE